MKRLLGLKLVANLALFVMLVGGLILTISFGTCLYMARQGVLHETNLRVEQSIDEVVNYVDDQLLRVEDVAYTLISSKFGSTVRTSEEGGVVRIDPRTLKLPTEEEVYQILEQFLQANPHICGVAIGFEPFLYKETGYQYGFAAYVTNVRGYMERLPIGNMHDYRAREWYQESAQSNASYWSRPFRETSMGRVVTCFSLPLHGYNDRLVGVLAVDIDTEAFRKKCAAVSPFPNAQVSIVDREWHFVSHTDSTYLLRHINEVGGYSDYRADDSMRIKMLNGQSGNYTVNEGADNEALFYFAPIARSGWTVAIECPSDEVFSGLKRMQRRTMVIGVLSIIFLFVCIVWLFRHVQKITISKAGMESELKVASGIQMGMIPKLYPAFPDRSEIDVCGLLRPAKSVGGDLYDYFIREDKFFFCIGDVSGKGVPASLFMAVIRALFRNVSLHTDNPAEILSSLNTALSEGNEHNMFCTMFLGVLDLKTGHLDYCNAGHNAPIARCLNPDGTIEIRYTKPMVNLAVGVFPGFPYACEHADMKAGEALFLYTDGVTEAENLSKQLLGDEATLTLLQNARKDANIRTMKDVVDYVYNAVVAFAAGAEQSDDITMVAIEYKGK